MGENSVRNIRKFRSKADTIVLQTGIPYSISITANQTILADKISCEMGEGLGIADSTRTGGTTNPLAFNLCNLYANPGIINANRVLRLTKVGNRLIANYYVVPLRKGVFYLFSDGLGGYFEGNSTSGKIKCRIVFDFDVADKHLNLLRTAIGQNNSINPMLQQMAGRGQGLYAFAVK